MPDTSPTGAAISEGRRAVRQLVHPGAGIVVALATVAVLVYLVVTPAREDAEARALACEGREAACATRLDTCYLGAKAGMGAAEGTR